MGGGVVMEMGEEALDAGDSETLGTVEHLHWANGQLRRCEARCRATRGSGDCLEHGCIEFEPAVNDRVLCSPVGALRGMTYKRECGDTGLESVSGTGWGRNGEGNPYLLFHGGSSGECKAPSSRGGGLRGGAYAYVDDGVNAVEYLAATELPERLCRREVSVDRPVLEETLEGDDVEVGVSGSVAARSIDGGGVDDMEEDVVMETIEGTCEAGVSETCGAEEQSPRAIVTSGKPDVGSAANGLPNKIPLALQHRAPMSRFSENGDIAVPACSGCGGRMRWTGYLGGAYAKLGSWRCDNFPLCKSELGNCGEERWFCGACNSDICRNCYVHWGELRGAFVAVVYGSDISYYIEAAVLGQCLRDVGTMQDCVLMHTDDVPGEWLGVFQKVGWRLKRVEYVDGEAMTSDRRFEGVFTKLHAIQLTEYEKIVLLDVDLLVRKNVDHLVRRRAPCAMRRHADGNLPDGAPITKGYINAGVMILPTSREQYECMMKHLKESRRNAARGAKQERSNQPEQDYLSKFYGRDWLHLGVEYNYQPHQLAFTDREGLENCRRLTMNVDQVFIAHFSALPKPVDWVLNREYRRLTQEEFIEGPLLEQYARGFGTDQRQRASQLAMCEIEKVLWRATTTFCKEWFLAWSRLAATQPVVARMVNGHVRSLGDMPLQLEPSLSGAGSRGGGSVKCCSVSLVRRNAPRMAAAPASPARRKRRRVVADGKVVASSTNLASLGECKSGAGDGGGVDGSCGGRYSRSGRLPLMPRQCRRLWGGVSR